MHLLPVALYVGTGVVFLVSLRKDREKTARGLRVGVRMLRFLAPRLMGMAFLVGTGLTLLPETALREAFLASGPGGYFLITTLGAAATMPAPMAFPLAASMLRLGASPASVAGFITTLTMVGVVTAPLEMSCLGRRFTLLRQGIGYVTALAVGALMGACL